MEVPTRLREHNPDEAFREEGPHVKTIQRTFRRNPLPSTLAIGLTCVAGQLSAAENIAGSQGSAQASAEGEATRVMWQRIVGIVVPDSIVGRRAPPPSGGCDIGVTCAVGAPAPWTATGGEAEVNLGTGDITFTVRGLVIADDFNFVNLGTPAFITKVKGTLVCNDTEPGFAELVDTGAVPLRKSGYATFSGRVDLPASCTDEPADIVFVIRIADASEFHEVIDMWNAFGAGRVIRRPNR
jgi:hypothetical protein